MTAVAGFAYRILRLFRIYAGIAVAAAGALFCFYQSVVLTEVAYQSTSSSIADTLKGVLIASAMFELFALIVFGYFLQERGKGKFQITAFRRVLTFMLGLAMTFEFTLRLSAKGIDNQFETIIVFSLLVMQGPALLALYVMGSLLLFGESPSETEDHPTKEKSDTF